MKTALPRGRATPTWQRGVTAVEMSLVAIPFFLMLLGAIEFGRLMYVWTTVQEVTRSAARQAVVTDFTDTGPTGAITQLKRVAVFRSTAGTLPAASEVSDLMVDIKYLRSDGLEVTSMPSDPGGNISECQKPPPATRCIKFVEVKICSGNPCVAVAFQPMFGMFPFLGDLKVPVSTVRMPAESLGFSP